jgi:hypothetical protein
VAEETLTDKGHGLGMSREKIIGSVGQLGEFY